MDRAELPDVLRDLYQKLGGNPNTLNPQPKAAMFQIMEYWNTRGLLPLADRLGIFLTATELQQMLVADPEDLDPVLVASFLATLTEIIDATKTL